MMMNEDIRLLEVRNWIEQLVLPKHAALARSPNQFSTLQTRNLSFRLW